MELQHLCPEVLEEIKQLNPDIRLLAYMTSQEIALNFNAPNEAQLRSGILQGIPEGWWLNTDLGDYVTFWTGTRMLNVTPNCPEIGGYRWNSFFSEFISDNVLINDIWDGMCLDNCWSNVSWLEEYDDIHDDFFEGSLDTDNDGYADDFGFLDSNWKSGMENMLQIFRENYPDKIFIGNAGYDYEEFLNGVLFEGYLEIGGNWGVMMNLYSNFQDNAIQPSYNIINAWDESGNSTNYQKMRFGLTTTLLYDGFYLFDKGPLDHSQLWWYDEYDIDLGSPLGTCENILTDIPINLVINGSFDDGAYMWSLDVSNEDAGAATVVEVDGDNCVKCIPGNSTMDYHFQVKQVGNSNFQLSDNGIYQLKFNAKASSDREISFMIMNDQESWEWFFWPIIITHLTTEWTPFSYTFTINIPVSIQPEQVRLSFHLGQDDAIVWIDDVIFCEAVNCVYKREFQNGIVLTNMNSPVAEPAIINLDNTYRRIDGSQDTSVNNGALCNSVILPPQDGIILLNEDYYDDEMQAISNTIHLKQNYPNPFNPTTSIEFWIPDQSQVSVKVYNMKGQLVKTISDKIYDKGNHIVTWDGTNKYSILVSSGIYLIKADVDKGDYSAQLS